MNYRNELHEKRNSYAKIAESQRPRMKAGSDKLRRIVILVEGTNDKSLYAKFIPEDRKKSIIIIAIKNFGIGKDESLKEYVNECKTFIWGGIGDVEGRNAIINTVKVQFALTNSNRIPFFGIVDKDYDDSDEEILRNCKNLTRYENSSLKNGIKQADIFSAGKLVCTDTNDVESLMLKFDEETIRKILIEKEYFPEKDIQHALRFVIESACKIGYLRKESHDKKLKINFKNIFHFNKPEDYDKYIKDEEFDISSVIQDLTDKQKKNIIFSEIPESFYGKEWVFCKGHDLTGILASYYVLKKYGMGDIKDIIPSRGPRETVIRSSESEMTKVILKNTKPERYKLSKVYKFIENIINSSNPI